MNTRKIKSGLAAASLGLLLLAAATPSPMPSATPDETADSPSLLQAVAPADKEAFFGGCMQRTMTLLATSNASQHNPVHIVIYGQSITGSPIWWKILEKQLRERFPLADLTVENRSIGGLEADVLARCAIHTLYPLQPDLIIFHSYGESADYERLVSDMRRYTTADIMLLTHHVMDIPKERGVSWETRNLTRDQDELSDTLRFLARKYSCELVEMRDEWKGYLHQHNLQPGDLVYGDGVHPNLHGQQLMAYLIARHFRYQTLFPDPWFLRVRSYDPRRPVSDAMNDEVTYPNEPWTLDHNTMIGSSSASPLRLPFDGTRVELIAGPLHDKNAKSGTARILIDGKPPSEHPECYAFTLPSPALGSWMPGLLRVTHRAPLVAEDWTLKVTTLNADATDFSYEVSGSVTGPDGTGTNKELFVSKSGRVVIEPRDLYRITWANKNTPQKLYPGFEVKWSAIPLFQDTYTPPEFKARGFVRATTVAQGLANTHHLLEVIPNGDGPVSIRAINAYAPPLKE